MTEPAYDLLIAGCQPASLSLAQSAQGAGIERVAVLAPGTEVSPHRAVGRFRLEVHYHATLNSVNAVDQELIEVVTPYRHYLTRNLVVAIEGIQAPARLEIPAGVGDRVHGAVDSWVARGQDVLAAGAAEGSAAAAIVLAEAGANVVVAFETASLRISPLARQELLELEAERRLTVLLDAPVAGIEDSAGNPMVSFKARRIPDLEFDHVVLVGDSASPVVPEVVQHLVPGDPRVFVLLASDQGAGGQFLDSTDAFVRLSEARFPDLPAWRQPATTGWVGGDEVSELESRLYNATITKFNPHHSDLWILRVRPDQGDVSFLPGQYATLGLGFWEPRVDNAYEDLPEQKRTQVARRSYSISSPIFDEAGHLIDQSRWDQLEFYIVLVRPTQEEVPAFTPRLALKVPGDRIYLGPKVTGRYTLERIKSPDTTVVFCSTGTGEAPHNAMVVELLRRGHKGPILNAVSVRYRQDLAYLAQHRKLEQDYSNYRYLTLLTRESDVEKIRLQDALERGMFEEALGGLELAPASTHFYLCGNPAMIGLPEWEGDKPRFPPGRGMAEMLSKRGFTIDRRGAPGNVHFEEYW
ncbi:MAG TPA: NAD(P)-binding domain-containing protein [Acidimicrobiia bacterium]